MSRTTGADARTVVVSAQRLIDGTGGRPRRNMALKNVRFVMKNGEVIERRPLAAPIH